MRKFLAAYRLHDGRRGSLHLLAADSCDAAVRALEALGQQRCALSVRPADARGLNQ
jgi:hypothetical protein